jgi:putative transposase
MHKQTFQYRIYPTPAQATAMQHALDECRWLYNRLLEERKVAWADAETTVTLYDQINRMVALKAERVTLADVHSQVLQNVAVRIDLAFKAFFRRVKAGETPGFPRFRGWGRYDSFCYPGSGHKVDGSRVFLSKIGHVKAIIHRPLEGNVKTCCVKRTATGKWYAAFSCEVEDAPSPAMDSAVGIDVGLASFATLSDGSEVANPRFFRADEQALAKAQRRLATEPKPAKGERATPARRKRRKVVARVHERIAHRRKDFAHQQSRRVVNQHDTIAVEDLSVNRMVHNHCLAKSIADAAWSMFSAFLSYKAASAGRQFIAVNPAYTSQDCSRCGHRQKLTLADRLYHCPCCGLDIGRDHNAAINIVTLGLQSLGAKP